MMMYLFLDETMIFSTERESFTGKFWQKDFFYVTVYLGPFFVYNLYIFVTTTYVRRVYIMPYMAYIYGRSILCLGVVCMEEEGERGKE